MDKKVSARISYSRSWPRAKERPQREHTSHITRANRTTDELEEHDAKKGNVVSPLRFLQTNKTLFERIFSLLLPYKEIEPKLFGGWGRMDLE